MEDILFKSQEKWQKIWIEKRFFESDANKNKKKFFITAAYPYMSGMLHCGHAYTYTRADIIARYKRLRGYNVLFPMGYHLTGAPIASKVEALRKGDKKIINDLLQDGLSINEIEKLKDVKEWVFFFMNKAKNTLIRLGIGIDWRRDLYTTYLNPWYDKFIQWQYRKLNEKGYISKGEHPVVWDPQEKIPVGDHDRPDDYAGIGPTEGYIIKFKLNETNYILPCFTLRPETVYGVTNVWIREDVDYIVVKVNDEEWIIPNNEIIIEEMRSQKLNVEKTDKIIRGKDLLGKYCINPVNNEKVPILKADFVDINLGTGIVMSVPSHAPYDYIALKELASSGDYQAQTALSNMKSLFILEGYTEFPAKYMVEKYGIKSQKDPKLEDLTKEIYSKEYYDGVLREIYGEFAGKKIYEVKDKIAKNLIDKNYALKYYTLTPRFKSRYGNYCVVKIIDNQWFLNYDNKEWKDKSHKCIDKMKFYPDSIRKDFHRVVDWLDKWPFAHFSKKEIGTYLPWDKDWVIESLSDSTIYPAFYTIYHLIKNIPPEKIEDDLFDYIFLGKGDEKQIISKYGEIAKKMREEFEYWYPLDIRLSGKDLVQNHLTFYIFHHVAIFNEDKWPAGIGINGWILYRGEKMSKSKGNYISVQELLSKYPVDSIRFLLAMNSTAGYDDVNLDLEIINDISKYLISWYKFSLDNYNKGDNNFTLIDEWFMNVMNKIMVEIANNYEEMNYRDIIQLIYMLDNEFNWYYKRRNGKINRNIINNYIVYKTIALYPITPHICSEILEKIGIDPLNIKWPEKLEYNEEIIKREEFVKRVREDIINIRNIAKVEKINRIKIIIASKEKYDILDRMKKGEKIQNNLANKIVELVNKSLGREMEHKLLEDSKDMFEKEFSCTVEIVNEEDENNPKKERALPYKPAIILE